MAKKAKKSTHTAVKTAKKRFRLTFFQIKIIVGTVVVLLSYRYPLQAVQNQEILTLVLVSFLILTKPSPFYRLMKKLSFPKLMFVLIFVTFIVPTLGYANTKYLDWDNAQMIKGLARDFPELVEQIEQATGLDLAVSSNCMTTTEKFSSGVKTCEFLYVLQTNNEEYVKKAFTLAEESSSFVKTSAFENGKGYRFKYRNQNSCSIANTDSIYGSCIIGVRDQNIELAKSMFTK
ncbi:MAG: hypothetical protein Q7T41_01520 [Candidatus Saccharibacteria bacterium]|nr:hypothetical protein [Candidatus Saccharibacteria bacterium]